MIQILPLDETERDQLATLALGVELDYRDFAAFAFACWRAGAGLPGRLARALYELRQGDLGPLLVKGLPVARPIPPTPVRRGDTLSDCTLHARRLMGVALSPLGHLFNLKHRTAFDLIDDLFPIYSDRGSQVGTNRDFLEWHVEDGFHPAKADLLALFCLRGDPAARTHLCEARDLNLPPALRRELEQPNYILRGDPTMAPSAESCRLAVLTPGCDPEIVYDPAYMSGLTPGAVEALEALRAEVWHAAQTATLDQGDLLILDNRRVLHARSEYRPAYDGTDRWLLRALLIESLWPKRDTLNDLEYGRLASPPTGADTARPSRPIHLPA